MGKWGNGEERKKRLAAAGYDYSKVQTIVNALVEGNSVPTPENREIEITGTETLKVVIDITKYNSIELTFIDGGYN